MGISLLQSGGISLVSASSGFVFFGVFLIWSTFKNQLNVTFNSGTSIKTKDDTIKTFEEKKK
jgi:hypothetical protein